MIRYLLPLFFLVGSPALAERVQVRSGEHPGFSRLVIAMDRPTGWQLGRRGEGYGLRLDRGGITLDTSDVFRRIPATRISAITPGNADANLQIDLGCECHANAFELRPGLLVIDVIDGRPKAVSRFEKPLAGSPRIVGQDWPMDKTDLYWRKIVRPAAVPAAGNERQAPVDVPEISPPSQTPEVDDAAGAAREDLLAELSRAVVQGLVELDPTHPAAQLPEVRSNLAIRTATAFDRGFERLDSVAPTAVSCPDPERLAIADWATAAPFSEQIGEARAVLLSEFDAPVQGSLDRLIRLNLHFGLGAEANALMNELPGGSDQDLLRAVAAVMEDDGAPNDALSGLFNCSGPVALWSFLSDAPTVERGIARGDILRGFSDLPQGLRLLVGPRIAGEFLKRKDQEAAQLVMDAMSRTAPAPSRDLRIVQGKIDGEIAENDLLQTASGQGEAAAEALIQLIEVRLRQGAPVEHDLTLSAETLAFELRGTQTGVRVAAWRSLALASSGAFEEAFTLLREVQGPDPGGLVRPRLFEMLTKSAPDTEFLRQVLQKGDGGTDDHAVNEGIARRLLDLGFPEETLTFVSNNAIGDGTFLLLAEAQIARGAPREALKLLAGESEPRVERIRAQALAALGDLQGATAAWIRAGDQDLAARAAWRGGAWSDVEELGPAEEREVAQLLRPPEENAITPASLNIDTEAPLASGRAMIERSRALREDLSALLATHQGPDVD